MGTVMRSGDKILISTLAALCVATVLMYPEWRTLLRAQYYTYDTDMDGIPDDQDQCFLSPPLGDPVTVNEAQAVPTVANALTTTTPIPGVANSGLGCTIQDIIDQAGAPASCDAVTLRRSVAIALRALLLGNDITVEQTAAIRSASFAATCPP